MITAKDALELYEKSGAEVQSLLDQKIHPFVEDAATRGKRTCNVHIGSVELYRNMEPTATENAAVEKLKSMGYTVWIAKYGESYVPRGLQNDDGDGPKYRNYGFIIGW